MSGVVAQGLERGTVIARGASECWAAATRLESTGWRIVFEALHNGPRQDGPWWLLDLVRGGNDGTHP